MTDVICPDCGAPMILRETTKFKTRDGKSRKFYGCSKYPTCNSTHGAHPDGRPLGIPADKQTKEMRTVVHKLCEEIWGEWSSSTKQDRTEMYTWFKRNAPKDHIAEMNMAELERTEQLLLDLINN